MILSSDLFWGIYNFTCLHVCITMDHLLCWFCGRCYVWGRLSSPYLKCLASLFIMHILNILIHIVVLYLLYNMSYCNIRSRLPLLYFTERRFNPLLSCLKNKIVRRHKPLSIGNSLWYNCNYAQLY